MNVDVALVPSEARVSGPGPAIVVDQIRASTTLTALLDLGAREVFVAGSVAAARRLARERGSLLIGERYARKPPDFDFDNSPTQLAADSVRERSVVLTTTNGTAVLHRLRNVQHVLVGCIRNATACADTAVRMAAANGGSVQVVCAGNRGRFVLDDAIAAGVIVGRLDAMSQALGTRPVLSDAATAVLRLRAGVGDLVRAMEDSDGGRTLARIGHQTDAAFCAEEDASRTVPILERGDRLRIVGAGRPAPGPEVASGLDAKRE